MSFIDAICFATALYVGLTLLIWILGVFHILPFS